MALSVHASPGVYAVLLGAGVSMPAGVQTGWGVVEDLVGRVAALRAVDGADERQEAIAAPQAWWLKTFGEQLSYSALLGQAAPTPAARQALLAGYFEPDEDGVKGPTEAHRAIAKLALQGRIRVILTTNFDRLMEQALHEVGIYPQIIRRPEAIAAMTPLAHAPVTLIKLHGDYADLDQRNTVDELETYDKPLQDLLDRVLDEYGLIVCGWSGDWDKALVRSIEGCRSRRYPLFWSSYAVPGDAAQRLTATHGAAVIRGASADELFVDLLKRLDALDTIAAPSITRDVAVIRLKKAMPDPVRRIEVSDLVMDAVQRVVGGAVQRHTLANADEYTAAVRDYTADTDLLLHLLATGHYFDDGTHAAVWRLARERLVRVRTRVSAGYHNVAMEALRHLPALLATWTMGVAAVTANREEDIVGLLSEPAWTPSTGGTSDPQMPVKYLNPLNMLDIRGAQAVLTAASGQGAKYPQSRLLRSAAREALRGIEPDDNAHRAACDRFELLASLLSMDPASAGGHWPWAGEFFLEDAWGYDTGLYARTTQDITPSWPLIRAGAFGGDVENAKTALAELAAWRARYHLQFPGQN